MYSVYAYDDDDRRFRRVAHEFHAVDDVVVAIGWRTMARARTSPSSTHSSCSRARAGKRTEVVVTHASKSSNANATFEATRARPSFVGERLGRAASASAEASCAMNARGRRGTIATGQPFLDHMIDQFTAHALMGVTVEVRRRGKTASEGADCGDAHDEDAFDVTGRAIGRALREVLRDGDDDEWRTSARARFASPLDEAYATCELDLYGGRGLETFALAPYGKKGTSGRAHIGTYPTAHTEVFWRALAEESGVSVRLVKERGENAHHIVESAFKAFARGLRAAMDRVEGIDVYDSTTMSEEVRQSVVKRSTKETSIDVRLDLDARESTSKISTGIVALDGLFAEIQREANIGLDIAASGDLWIDDHHTAEDVSIAVGQALNKALATKKGCNRMGSATATTGAATVECVMDLSNRPYLGYGLEFNGDKVGDLSVEMVEHVFMSLTFNGQMTVHLVQHTRGSDESEIATAAAKAFGKCLRQCAAIDPRRAGSVASSKGTLSV